MTIDRRNDIFFVGAGVSLAPPSELPSGEQFACEIFDLLCDSGDVCLSTKSGTKLRAQIGKRLRLEVFLETLASRINPSIVVSPFASLTSATPNRTHFTIAALSGPNIVTTNQDLLLESACKSLGLQISVLHLHGTCNRLSSISTTISQYLRGLEGRKKESFEAAIRDRRVIVVGYSGRDLDVMPILTGDSPAQITWILHEGDPSRELAYACEHLGSRLELVRCETLSWLSTQLTIPGRLRVAESAANLPMGKRTIPDSVKSKFAAIGSLDRNWALGRILERLGRHKEAFRIYRRLALGASTESARLFIDLGRATARVKGHDAARSVFSSLLARPEISTDVRASALLARSDAFRNTSQIAEGMRDLAALDQLLKEQRADFKCMGKEQRYWHTRGWMFVAMAGIQREAGRAKAALQLYARAEKALCHARDIDGRTEVLTWQAECLLIQGDYRKALVAVDVAIGETDAYAKDLVLGWPWFVKAEALALSGRCSDAMVAVSNAETILRRSENIQGPLWCQLLKSDCYRETSVSDAARSLESVRDGLRHRRLEHLRARLVLEEAELARTNEDWSRMDFMLARLRMLLAKNSALASVPPRLLAAHALLVKAEAARQREDVNASHLLMNVRSAYQALGAMGLVMRTNVALFLVGNRDIELEELLARCREHQYGYETERLEGTRTGFYPIHFV